MKMKLILAIASFFILSGCASVGQTQKSEIERITPEELAKLLPPAVATVTLEEIVADSKQGLSAEAIIAKIKESDSRYELSPSQILDLSKQGAEVKVLDYIQQSNELAKQNAIAEEMNRREQEAAEVKQALTRERLRRHHRHYDPFWGSRFYYHHRIPIAPAGNYWRGRRHHGWGLFYGPRFGW